MRKIIAPFGALILFFVLIGVIYSSVASAEETSAEKKLIFHYLRFDGEYDDVGIHLWNTGAGGTAGTIEKTGVDNFGAYFEINIGEGATKIGSIPLELKEDRSPDWDKKATFNNGDIMIDVTPLFDEDNPKNEMHVFFMQNGEEVLLIDDYDDNLNYIFVVYADEGNKYNNWGIYTWNTGTNGSDTNPWGENNLPFGATSYTTTNAFPFKLGAIAVDNDAADEIGFIVTNGTDKAYDGDILIDTETVKADGQQVLYYVSGKESLFNNAEDFFDIVNEFAIRFEFLPYNPNPSNDETKGTYAMSPNAINVEFNQEVIVGVLDENNVVVANPDFNVDFFTLKDEDGQEYNIDVTYLSEKLAVTEFVITFKDEEFRLDHTKKYTLYYDNGLEDGDLAQQKAEIEIDLDREAPIIQLISGKTVVEINQYDEFIFPDFVASDNRDGDITRKVYVPEGKGNLDTGLAKDQKITLAVSDSWGHVTELEITVKVKVADSNGISTGLLIAIIAGGVVVLGGAGYVLIRKKSA